MPSLTIELPEQREQNAFNLRRWEAVLADPRLAKVEGRIETDRHGHILMSPPPAPTHGGYQAEIAYLLRTLIGHGRVLTECPISTADGVRAADVAWASAECIRKLGNRSCFLDAPEICVEVMSPGNSASEIKEKIALFIDAGAQEVWICERGGAMSFFAGAGSEAKKSSPLCPQFPGRIELR